jgi:glycosyltransferase involved in cell wall biosynthesis
MRVSVIMPAYNSERHIDAAIESCLKQLSSDDELIIIDNASTDSTALIVRANPDPRIRYLFEPKQGVAAARNKGLRHGHGKFVAFLDSDDLWPEDRQPPLIGLLEAHPEIDAVYGKIRLRFDSPGSPRMERLDGTLAVSVHLSPFLFRREVIERIGDMDETLRLGSDADYLARLQEAGMNLLPWDGDALIYRQHETNLTLAHEKFKSGQLSVIARKIRRKRMNET